MLDRIRRVVALSRRRRLPRGGRRSRSASTLAALGVLGSLVLPAHADVQARDDRGHTVRLPHPAQRVVTLLPSLTETVCALQACDRLVAVDRFSDWPAAVHALPKVGDLEAADIERIVALHPDLVLAAVSTRAVGRLEALGLTVATLEPQSHADTGRVIGAIAQLLGREAEGRALWQQLQQQTAAAAARVPAGWQGRRVYFEVDATPYAAGPSSFIGETLHALGLGNIVPASLGAFPKLNPEFVVRAQPQLVIGARHELQDMAQRPGWAALRALQTGAVCAFDEPQYEVLIRPGPRLGEAAGMLADCLVRLAPPRSEAAQGASAATSAHDAAGRPVGPLGTAARDTARSVTPTSHGASAVAAESPR